MTPILRTVGLHRHFPVGETVVRAVDGFFRLAYALANGTSTGLVDPPLLHLLAVVPVTMLVAGAVATFPAASLRRLPVAAALSPA